MSVNIENSPAGFQVHFYHNPQLYIGGNWEHIFVLQQLNANERPFHFNQNGRVENLKTPFYKISRIAEKHNFKCLGSLCNEKKIRERERGNASFIFCHFCHWMVSVLVTKRFGSQLLQKNRKQDLGIYVKVGTLQRPHPQKKDALKEKKICLLGRKIDRQVCFSPVTS